MRTYFWHSLKMMDAIKSGTKLLALAGLDQRFILPHLH